MYLRRVHPQFDLFGGVRVPSQECASHPPFFFFAVRVPGQERASNPVFLIDFKSLPAAF